MSIKDAENFSVYQTIFNAPLFFDQEFYALEFDASTLDAKTTQADLELKSFFSRYVSEQEGKYKRDTISVVEHLIRSLLSTGRCTEERIANTLQINRRTLQRKLKAEGVSFNQLLAQIRGDLAEQYLLETNIPFTHLAITLGYSELSAFTRFFKNRFGMSPSEYKRIKTTSE